MKWIYEYYNLRIARSKYFEFRIKKFHNKWYAWLWNRDKKIIQNILCESTLNECKKACEDFIPVLINDLNNLKATQ